MSKYFINQMGDKDCGFTCLKMLLATVYENSAYLYYPEKNFGEASTIKDLMEIAQKEGMTLAASRAIEKEELFKESLQKPLLCLINSENELHMVMVTHVSKSKISISDPAKGRLKMSKDDFIKIWNGEFLEVTKAEEVRINYDEFFVDIIPRHTIGLTLVFQFLSLVSLLLTMFLIDKSLNYIIPICLFGLYLAFEFIYQRTIILSLKKFDNAILMNNYMFKRENFKDYYEPMSKFKVILISGPIKLLSAVVIVIFGIFILGINSIYNLIVLSILFIIQGLFKIFDKKYFDNERVDLERLESNLFRDKNLDELHFKRDVMNLNKKSYKIVSYMNLKKYLLFFVTLGLCLIYQVFTGFISIDFMLFHLFLYIYLEENFDKILSSSELRYKYRYYKCLYLHYFR